MITFGIGLLVGVVLGALFAWPYAFKHVYTRVLDEDSRADMAHEAILYLNVPVEYIEVDDVDSGTTEE